MAQADATEVSNSPKNKINTTRDRVRWAAGGTALFLLGFVGEAILSELKELIFPDSVKLQVTNLQSHIETKTNDIISLSKDIENKLADMGSDIGLEQEAKDLLAAIESLRPDILKAANVSSENLQRVVSAKERELATRGVSASSDIELLPGRGATVCGFGNSFGFRDASGGRTIIAQLSVGGTGTGEHYINPGSTLSRPNGEGKTIAVNYVGFNDATGLYAFDVSCPG